MTQQPTHARIQRVPATNTPPKAWGCSNAADWPARATPHHTTLHHMHEETHALVVAPSTTGFSYSTLTLCVLSGSSAKRLAISSRPRSSVTLFS